MSAVGAWVLAIALAAAGHAARWLTGPGAVAAALVGWVVLSSTGLRGGSALALLFVTGSVLTFRRRPPAERKGRRARQVVANGGWAALGALLTKHDPSVGWAVLGGSLAAAQADTWATEIGLGARQPPRSIVTWRPVPPGTSGGVTLRGTLGGVAGATLLGAWVGALLASPGVAVAVAVGGMLGMLLDSWLGATLQARYRCTGCGAIGEARRHDCGAPALRIAGLAGIDNDVVNGVATAAGAAAALAIQGWGFAG